MAIPCNETSMEGSCFAKIEVNLGINLETIHTHIPHFLQQISYLCNLGSIPDRHRGSNLNLFLYILPAKSRGLIDKDILVGPRRPLKDTRKQGNMFCRVTEVILDFLFILMRGWTGNVLDLGVGFLCKEECQIPYSGTVTCIDIETFRISTSNVVKTSKVQPHKCS